LLGDIIYEGARGVSGQYLQILGVNAATVGFIVGLGELLGYLFRLASGFFADKTKIILAVYHSWIWPFNIRTTDFFNRHMADSRNLDNFGKNWQGCSHSGT